MSVNKDVQNQRWKIIDLLFQNGEGGEKAETVKKKSSNNSIARFIR